MTDLCFRTLLDMAMKFDPPGPLDGCELGAITEVVQAESKSRGYDDWVDAYHTFVPVALSLRTQ